MKGAGIHSSVKKLGSKNRRRWWQHTLRALLAIALLLTLAYASLPWWLPTQWIGRQVAQGLSQQLGVAVQVGDISVSWREGVSIGSIKIANPDGFGPQAMLEIDRIRCDFSPLRIALRHRLSWMEIEEPQLRLALDGQKQLNLGKMELPLPVLAVDRTSVKRASVTLSFPEDPDRLRLDVADLQMEGGRAFEIGRLTMSASLNQPSRNAPVGLVVLTGSAAGNAKAVLEFSFAGVNLQEIQLARLLGLPLNRLEGLCDGWLECRVNNEGVVEGVSLRVQARGLDVEPRSGYRLPRIEQTGLRLSASFDPLGQLVGVDSLSLQLPGLELQGKGEFHTSLLAGNWMGGRSCQLSGKINPAAVSTLFLGKPEPLLGLLNIDGDVGLNVAYQQAQDRFQARLDVDATAATLTHDGRVLKPAGETLTSAFSASCMAKTWQFVMDRTELRLGQNDFVGQGALDNIRRAVLNWVDTGPDRSLANLQDDLAGLDWQGSMMIRELESLRRLDDHIVQVLAPVQLNGSSVFGGFNLKHDREQGTQFSAQLATGKDGTLRIGNYLSKPSDQEMNFSIASTFDEPQRTLREATLKATSGGELLVHITRASALPVLGRPMGPVSVEGTYQFGKIEQLRHWIPVLSQRLSSVSGAGEGTFSAVASPERANLKVSLDATNLSLHLRPYLEKVSGRQLHIESGFDWEKDTSNLEATLDATDAAARISARATVGPQDWDSHADVHVLDAEQFLQQFPAVCANMSDWEVAGAADVSLHAHGRGEDAHVSVEAKADGLEITQESAHRHKAAGVPLTLAAAADLGEGEAPSERMLDISRMQLQLGESRMDMDGRTAISETGQLTPVRVQVRLAARTDEPLLHAVPELATEVQQYQVSGGLEASARAVLDNKKWALTGGLDAKELAFRTPEVAKAAGLPAEFKWSGRAPTDWSSLYLTDWRGQIGPSGAMGDLRVDLATKAGIPAAITALRSHFRCWIEDASGLPALVPSLANARPSGRADLEAELHVGPEQTELLYAIGQFSDLSATLYDKRISLDGAIRGEKISSLGRADRIVADNLLLKLNDSDLHVIVDLQHLPAGAKGKVTLLSQSFDSGQLRALAVAYCADCCSAARPASAPATQPDKAELARCAEQQIARLRQLFQDSDVTVSANLQRVLNWLDVKVNAVYDVENAVVRGRVHNGQVSLEYQAGVNGGTVTESYETNLNAPTPEVVQASGARDLMAGKNLQPQVEAFFPGNEVKGSMTRQMKVTSPLRDFIANAADPRYPLHTVGSGTTHFVKGVTRGRAAPNFVTRVFPGLNLVEYEYERMTSFSEFRPDGSAYNDMIFSGKSYDMYVEGVTDANQVGKYEIGLILLGTPQTPEWNHRYRQGRLPLLKWQAQIVGGKRVNEQVLYPWPNETMFRVFLQDNIVYRLWLASHSSK